MESNRFLFNFVKERQKEALQKKLPTTKITPEQKESGLDEIILNKPGKKEVVAYFKQRVLDLSEKYS
jgi:hypothetical protein